MLLCCLTKKVGVYVVLLSCIITLIALRKKVKQLLIPILSSVFLMTVLLPGILAACEVEPGGKQEMLSLPFQMTARCILEHYYDFSQDELNTLNYVLDIDTIADDYNPISADPVKHYSQKGDDEDYTAYLKLWLVKGIRHPGTYFRATMCMLSGWFSWSEYDPRMDMNWRSQINTGLTPDWIVIRTFSENTANAYREFYHRLYGNALFRVFLSYGFYSALIPAFAVGTVFQRNRKGKTDWLAVLPTLFSLALGCWLAPLSIHYEGRRYLFPITYTAPLLIMWCLYVMKKEETPC